MVNSDRVMGGVVVDDPHDWFNTDALSIVLYLRWKLPSTA